MSLDCIHLNTFVPTFLICGLLVLVQGFRGEVDLVPGGYSAQKPFVPTFVASPGNVTFIKGEQAKLPCVVEHRGTRTIVWRRITDTTPITIGHKTYVGDTRFKVSHPRHSLEWNLLIENVQPEDAGVYECQVAAVARDIRQLVNLTVDESSEVKSHKPDISIHGTFFVERGDTLKLVCNATGSEYPPADIDWFKDGDKIKNSERVTLRKDLSLSESTIISSLYIRRGHMRDTGTYVCRTSDLQVTSAKVNVLNTGTKNEKRESQPEGSLGIKPTDESGTASMHTSRLALSLAHVVLWLILLWFPTRTL